MAIVPDLAGVRPGRPGNLPLSDPHNPSRFEYAKKVGAGFAVGPLGNPDAGEVFPAYTVPSRCVIIPEECVATFDGVAAADAVYAITVNDNIIGTMTVLAGTDIPIFGFLDLAVYHFDRLTFVAPNPQDATLTGFSATITLQRYGEV